MIAWARRPATQSVPGGDELARFRHDNGKLLWTLALFSMVVNLLMMTGPIYMLQVYERLLASGSVETLVALSLLAAVLFCGMGLLDALRGRVAARYGARMQAALEAPVFRAALGQAARTGQAPGALSDLARVQGLTGTPVFLSLFDLPWLPLFLGLIFVFHPWLGWLAVAGGVALILVSLLNRRSSTDPLADAAEQAERARLMAHAIQTEAETIRALGMAPAAFARWQLHGASALRSAMHASDLMGGYAALTRTMRLVLQSAILALAAWLVLRGELSAGAMIAASILVGRALAPIDQIVGQWTAMAEAARGWARLRALLREEPAPIPRLALPRPAALLEVSHLSIVPPGAARSVLRGVHFRLMPGQAIAVIGPSGSGKSTLARALVGVWSPSAGQIRLGGRPIDQIDPDALGAMIGYLPQQVRLFDGTVAENIARLAALPHADAVLAAARQADAHDMICALPHGYDTRLTGLGAQLSGGQVQRIGLARALYRDPVLLVLDEPNSALDNDGSEALTRAIEAMKSAGCTVVVMAHRPSAIRACDMVLVLQDGVQQAFGPRDAVLEKTLVNYREIRQTRGFGVQGGAA